jgi:hypothetical protein
MKRNLRSIRLPALLAAVAIIIAGCIVSGQFVIVLNIDNEMVSTNQALSSTLVDLTDNETWKDHEKDIQNIVDVKFEATIVNNRPDSAWGSVYFADREFTDADSVRAGAVQVLGGIRIPGWDSVQISFSESAVYMPELEKALDFVESGKFYVYGIADTPFSITIRPGARLMITFSAG